MLVVEKEILSCGASLGSQKDEKIEMAFSETNSGHCWSNQKSGELLNLIPCEKE